MLHVSLKPSVRLTLADAIPNRLPRLPEAFPPTDSDIQSIPVHPFIPLVPRSVCTHQQQNTKLHV